MATRPARTSSRRKAPVAAAPDCATAFQKIALDCVAAIKAHHTSACAGDAEAVHQIRVAITRLRAAVAFFASIVVDAKWLRLRKEIAWLNGSLGAARDSDVVVEYARRKRYRAWGQRMIGKQLDESQTQDHRRLVRCLRSVRTQRLIVAMAAWIRQGPWLERHKRREDAEALQSYCARELNRWHERLVRKGRHLKTLGASRRHRLRIKAKHFRYMLEALTETVDFGGRNEWRHLHRPAKRLQRVLGDMRDLERFAGSAGGSPQAENIKRGRKHPPGYRRQREKLLSAAIAAHRDLKHAGAC
ncbi:CHAD domain-containing protein [Bradyrhizobium sp. AUGA SZCCT0283]|uniref:CHAD domain-containing protein n=1 Tax=Bradyrhizobium sp. AUGA SZCCT0283 TaxID=2807671 RepID=UPI001BA8B797|nr:CHAD domain-containing protein [Bradyrhizobium sp. AUGA SZCCT0283]MBR1277824.1 CHAD domain-containing protein [Bradyrhizobium sp. AUGA SZCCT0283]